MATRFWTPGDRNWNQTNNWSATQGGATGAGVPVNTNDVYLLGGAFGIDPFDASAVTLNSMTIQDGFGGNQSGMTIGDGAQALKVNITNDLTILSQRITSIRFDGTVGGCINLKKFIGGNFFFQGAGVAAEVRLPSSGYFNATSAVKVTRFSTAGAGFLIADDTSSPVDLVMGIATGAQGECQRKIHSLYLAGSLKLTGAANGSATTGTSRWVVASGGSLDIRSSGNINEVEVLPGGRITGENSPGFGTKPTITVIQHEGSDVRLPSSLFTVTTKAAGIVPGSS